MVGKDLFNRRRYEEAASVFEAMKSLDERNLDAELWLQKCHERLSQEKNENTKAQIIKQQGSLKNKESGYENWTWGPTSGHFEIRTSKPKPHIIPPKKIRPRATDGEVAKAMLGAAKNNAKALFDLAMLHHSRKEPELAIMSWERAVEIDANILALDDEGLTSTILEEADKALENGTITPELRLLTARVSLWQGDWGQAITHFIKAASKNPALKDKAGKGLKKIIDSGKTDFLKRPPDIDSIFLAYAFENKEDRLYFQADFIPRTPLYIFPFDLEVESAVVKSVEILSPDVLFVFRDPFTTDTSKLWIVGKDSSDQFKRLRARLIVHLDPAVNGVNISNYNCEGPIPGNWGLVFGLPESFYSGFLPPVVEKNLNGVLLKAYQLSRTNGKGPTLVLQDFRKPLPAKIDVWKCIEEIGREGAP